MQFNRSCSCVPQKEKPIFIRLRPQCCTQYTAVARGQVHPLGTPANRGRPELKVRLIGGRRPSLSGFSCQKLFLLLFAPERRGRCETSLLRKGHCFTMRFSLELQMSQRLAAGNLNTRPSSLRTPLWLRMPRESLVQRCKTRHRTRLPFEASGKLLELPSQKYNPRKPPETPKNPEETKSATHPKGSRTKKKGRGACKSELERVLDPKGPRLAARSAQTASPPSAASSGRLKQSWSSGFRGLIRHGDGEKEREQREREREKRRGRGSGMTTLKRRD